MSKKTAYPIALALVFVASALFLAKDSIRGIWPLLKPVPDRTATSTLPYDFQGGVNTTGIPLTVPSGFSISLFAEDLPGVRTMIFDQFGNMWVSQPSEGSVSLIEMDEGVAVRHGAVFKDLQNPHGLALDPQSPLMLHIAEEHRVSNVALYSEDSLHELVTLPADGGHSTRTVGFGPDGRIYVSIGSSCNVCNESDPRRAAIYSMSRDGSDFKEYARGLRNSVFFAWHPETKELWATDMGRDWLGNDVPPDELNVVRKGGNYGWPVCYGKNVHDTDFDKNVYVRNPCMEPLETPSLVDIPAHSAPLGLAFVPGAWGEKYANDLIVAYHGSWNRSEPTGYKLVRMKFGSSGEYEGTDDFITGWLEGTTVHGRPAGVIFGPDEALYVSDDRQGVIYRITKNL